MTTYTTPHFANGPSDRNVRPSDRESNTTRARAASPVYKTAAVSNEGALLADAYTPDWQPNKASGAPKAVIGVLGAAVIGGIAVAALMLAPADKVTKTVTPDPIAAAATQGTAAGTDTADAAVSQMDKQAPAAGLTAAPATPDATAAQAAAAPAPVVAPAPVAKAPVITAPVARVPHRTVAPAPEAAPAPVVTPPANTVAAPDQPVVTPSAAPQQPDSSTPAMQQTPAAPTVTPATPAPAPAPVTPDSGSSPGGNQ